MKQVLKIDQKKLVSTPYRDDKNKKIVILFRKIICVSTPYRDDKNNLRDEAKLENLRNCFNPL